MTHLLPKWGFAALLMLSGWLTSIAQAFTTDSIVAPIPGSTVLKTQPNLPQPATHILLSTGIPDTGGKPDSLLRLKTRTWTIAGLHAGLYAGTLILLNEAWYKNYPKGKFHTFNDWPEWKQVDKVGHTWSAYQLSRLSHVGWEWAGLPHRQQIWLAGLSGFTFQTVIEILDGFSAEWGWSWADFGANAIGSGMFIAQNLAWQEERISFKFSFHRMNYSDPLLNARSDELYGASLLERMLKDYNGQTYWLSANLKSFFPKSKLPPWLNIAMGYGAEGMFGGTENKWIQKSTGQAIDRTDIARVRQWYLSPDIDFTRIKTRKAWLKTTFRLLNAFKVPAPAMVFSNGRLRFHALYF
jgi:hypothetical protein